MSLLEDLNWRYATKKMNGESVPQEKVDYIVEAARLAPTSSGLQPFKIIEITSPELKAKIQPIAFGQSQIVDASHLLVFAAYDEYKNNLFSSLQQKTKEQHFEHSARQAYIGFGLSIAAAAEQKVDATPMEGFNNAQLDELLGLQAQGLKSVTILTLGYRDVENDWLGNLKKVRIAKQDFVIQLN